MPEYEYPEVLVEADWLAAHLDDLTIRIVESDENPGLYAQGHIPNAILIHLTEVRKWLMFARLTGTH